MIHRNICVACQCVTYRPDYGDSCMKRCERCEAKWEREIITFSEERTYCETYRVWGSKRDLFKNLPVQIIPHGFDIMLVVNAKKSVHEQVYAILQQVYWASNALYCESYDSFMHHKKAEVMSEYRKNLQAIESERKLGWIIQPTNPNYGRKKAS